jgi:hypothetical protein
MAEFKNPLHGIKISVNIFGQGKINLAGWGFGFLPQLFLRSLLLLIEIDISVKNHEIIMCFFFMINQKNFILK